MGAHGIKKLAPSIPLTNLENWNSSVGWWVSWSAHIHILSLSLTASHTLLNLAGTDRSVCLYSRVT